METIYTIGRSTNTSQFFAICKSMYKFVLSICGRLFESNCVIAILHFSLQRDGNVPQTSLCMDSNKNGHSANLSRNVSCNVCILCSICEMYSLV